MPSVPVAAVAVVAALVASGCTAGQADTPPMPRTADGRPACPLTGLPVPSGVDPSRPAVAVKVGNSADARPQSGLAAADLVYEEPVEGGLAWFVAVFHCGDAELVGPVRHAHPADAGILAAHGPVLFAHAGASGPVAAELEAVKVVEQADGRLGGEAFRRVDDRAVPNNLYVSLDALRSLAGRSDAGPRPWVRFEDSATPQGDSALPTPSLRAAAGVTFTQGGSQVGYTWDGGQRAWVRSQGDVAFTSPDGRPVPVRNVVFLWVPVGAGAARDAAGNPTPVVTFTGEGDALVLRDGTEQSARWHRPSIDDPSSLTDADGAPLTLPPGNTWIHLLPLDTPVFVR